MINNWQAQDIEKASASIKNPASRSQSTLPLAQTTTSLPSATTIFGQAWTIYKQRLGTFLEVTAIPTVIMIALTAILGSEVFSNAISKFTTGGIAILYLAIIFIGFIIQGWGQIALLYAIKDSQEKIGVIESYRRGWHKIISYCWVCLLAGFITLGGFFILIVPGVIFTIWFSLAVFVLISEDLRGMDALLKSREYVKGKWGSVCWRFFFIGAIAFIIFLVPTIISGFLKIPFAKEISNFIIGLFLTPLIMTYTFLVYSNLKAFKREIIFTPTGRQKATFIIIGLSGILIILAILFLSFYF